MINKLGLKRDCLIAIEHFRNTRQAKNYIMEEFKNEYKKEEIQSIFSELCKYKLIKTQKAEYLENDKNNNFTSTNIIELKNGKMLLGKIKVKSMGLRAYCNIIDPAGAMALIYEEDNHNNYC